jgi:hypothetical protein
MQRRALVVGALAAVAGLAFAAEAPAPAPAPARQARVIKPPPAVAPDQAAKALAAVPLTNAGFESTVPGKAGSPEGWWAVQHAGPLSYTFEPDTNIRRGGERSLRVTNVGPEPFGAVYQTVPASAHRGRTLRVSAWLRTEGTTGNRYGSGAGLKLHSVRGGYAVDLIEMRRDAVHGTTDWARYELALKVPVEAEALEVGLVLFGPGTVWIDDVALDVVGDLPSPVEVEARGVAK